LSILPGLAIVVMLLPVVAAAREGLVLKRDLELRDPAAVGPDGPLFLMAERIESTAPNVVEASGRVEARRSGTNFFANWLRYDTVLNSLEARGAVRLEEATLDVRGDTLKVDLDTFAGELTQPVYQLPQRPGRGAAERVEFFDRERFRMKDATYTTCPVGNDDWYLKVDKLDIDQGRNVGAARNASLRFLGVPILYTPWMDFALRDERKTGVLAPTFGTTERSGLDILLPYYLNLAPHYDATLYPRLLSKRGMQLGVEMRYLLPALAGENRFEYLPDDRQAERSRWSAALKNEYRINESTRAGMNFNRVSDDDYFRDLSNLIAVTSQVHVVQEAWLITQRPNWHAEIRAQHFQTLQDSTATAIEEPYERLPQARLGMHYTLPYGLEFRLNSEATRFAHSTKIEGTRVLAYPTLRLPLVHAFGFLTPQIGWHSSYYMLDDSAPDSSITRNVPIFSLDTGTALERPYTLAGGSYIQTLEPRVYYVFAPFRDQANIPVFDSAQIDFSYAQMFTENQFIGGDRINDANQLTLALTSRFVEADSGLERLQVTLGQRYYFDSQQVTLPGVAPRATNATDLLVSAGGQITRNWRVDTAWQFDTETGNTLRQNLAASYRPSPGRVLNLSYRFVDEASEQVDFSGQWPLGSRWYGMFRYNHSLRDNKLIEGLAGLEYNGGCWAIRSVFQRLVTKEDQTTDTLFFQLELNGMGRIGSNPLDVLKLSVPGYQTSHELTPQP